MMPSEYPPNWPLSEKLSLEEWPTPIALRPRTHSPRHYTDSSYPNTNQSSQRSIDSYEYDIVDSYSQTPDENIKPSQAVRKQTQSEDSWYVGDLSGDCNSLVQTKKALDDGCELGKRNSYATSMQSGKGQSKDARNGQGNRDSHSTSIISQIPTWDSTNASSIYSTSTVPDDNSLDFLDYYASSVPSGNKMVRETKPESTGGETGTPTSIGVFCDQVMDSYKNLGPSSMVKSVSLPSGLGANIDKPLPPLPRRVRPSISITTLCSNDFQPGASVDKENIPTAPSSNSPPLILHDNRGGSVLNREDMPRRADGGPGLPLPVPEKLHTDDNPELREAVRLLFEHKKARQPYIDESSFLLRNNLGLAGEELNDLSYTQEGFGPALDLRAVQGNFRDVTGTPEHWGQRTRLRETLLAHGLEKYGKESKVELSSLSFHDVTPGEDGRFRNELLGHYDVGVGDYGGPTSGPKTKLLLYEVEIPLPCGPDEVPTTERWLHLLISVPFVPTPPPLSTPPSFVATPPPPSWVAIAVPIHSLTVHAPTRETHPPATFLSRPKNYIRHDFDFGINEGNGLDGYGGGRKTPQFEFMDKLGKKDLFPEIYARREGLHGDRVFGSSLRDAKWPTLIMRIQNEVGPHVNFLAPRFPKEGDIKDMGLSLRGRAGHARRLSRTLSGEKTRSRSPSKSDGTSTRGRHRLGQGLDFSLVLNEQRINQRAAEWHADVVDRVREDGARWERIHECMLSGKCRVICRVEEQRARGMGLGMSTVLRSASKKLGKTGLSNEFGR